jgi:peroxiredoxin Q/BCP
MTRIATLALVLLAGLAAAAPLAAAPQVGDPAPDWTLPASDGATYSLSDLRGQYVVIAFFPKAFTGGCTIECKALRDADVEIRNYDVSYFMASTDSLEDNTGFAEQNDAGFPILADPSGAMAEAYGVRSPSGMAKRWTFYIDERGVIRHIDRDVNPRTAGEQLVLTLEQLEAPHAAGR